MFSPKIITRQTFFYYKCKKVKRVSESEIRMSPERCLRLWDLQSADEGVAGTSSADWSLLMDTLVPTRSILVLRQVLEQTFVCW